MALYSTMTKLSTTVVSLFEPVWRLSARKPPLQVTVNSVDEKATADRVLLEQAELLPRAWQTLCATSCLFLLTW
jgi:hypothetical protein